MKKAVLFLAVALAPFAAHAGIDDAGAIPWVKDSGREVYKEKFLAGQKHKAFAISKAGNHGWSAERDSASRAARSALYNCFKNSTQRCFLYAVDDKLILDDYAASEEEAKAVLGKLALPAKKAYSDEDKETGVSPTESLKQGNLHEPTPTTVAVAKTVTTSSLVEMLTSTTKPVVLDVLLPTDNFRKALLPSAYWISGAGISDEKNNTKIDDNFAKIMSDIAPKKDTPIVVYCLSWECWLSPNALLRLSKQGYTNLYWYRGGIESWQRAGLPTVEAPMTAQVW